MQTSFITCPPSASIVLSAMMGDVHRPMVSRGGASKYQIRKGSLKKATCISKPDNQDLIDFVSFFLSLFIVHLLKSSQSRGIDWDFSASTLLTFGAR